MDGLEHALRAVAEVSHKHLDALGVDVLAALGVVLVGHVGELAREALLVENLLGVDGLVRDHLVGHHDALEAGLLAVGHAVLGLFVAAVQAQVVVGVDHALGGLLHVLERLLVKSGLHKLSILL